MNSDLVAKGFAVEVKGRPSPEGGEMCDNSEGRNVRFHWSEADRVSVAGSFSNWRELSLKRGYVLGMLSSYSNYLRTYWPGMLSSYSNYYLRTYWACSVAIATTTYVRTGHAQ